MLKYIIDLPSPPPPSGCSNEVLLYKCIRNSIHYDAEWTYMILNIILAVSYSGIAAAAFHQSQNVIWRDEKINLTKIK